MDTPRPLQSLSVAVVGGGAAGLVAARELLREGHQVTVFEKGACCGGVWVYSDDVEEEDLLGRDPGRQRVHCSLYAGLRTNTTRENMGLSDFPFDYAFPGSADPCQFCSHEEVLRFLDAFIEKYDLGRVVQTRTEVVAVHPAECCDSSSGSNPKGINAGSGDGSANGCEAPLDAAAAAAAAAGGGVGGSTRARWEVTVQQLDGTGRAVAEQQVLLFDAVVICNGHFSEPQAPQDLV